MNLKKISHAADVINLHVLINADQRLLSENNFLTSAYEILIASFNVSASCIIQLLPSRVYLGKQAFSNYN